MTLKCAVLDDAEALGFNRKLGFTPSGAQEFRCLDDRHNDLVLERPVGGLPCYNKA